MYRITKPFSYLDRESRIHPCAGAALNGVHSSSAIGGIVIRRGNTPNANNDALKSAAGPKLHEASRGLQAEFTDGDAR